MRPRKILLIRFSSWGDIVICSPVMRLLKTQLPDVDIHFLCKPNNAFLVIHNPYVSKVITLKKSFQETVNELKGEQYDLVIDLHKNLRSNRFKMALGVKHMSFEKRNLEKFMITTLKWRKKPLRHLADRYIDALEPLGIEDDGKGLDYFPAPDTQLPPNLPSKYIAWGIGGSFNTKRMPADKMIEIVTNIKIPLVLLGGPDDIAAANLVADHFGPANVLNLVGKISLDETYLVLKYAQVVMSNDTATLHMAAALDQKILAIWGSTSPEIGMYPYLSKNGNGAYTNIRATNVSCQPCSKIGHRECPKKHFDCMYKISETDVIHAIQKYA